MGPLQIKSPTSCHFLPDTVPCNVVCGTPLTSATYVRGAKSRGICWLGLPVPVLFCSWLSPWLVTTPLPLRCVDALSYTPVSAALKLTVVTCVMWFTVTGSTSCTHSPLAADCSHSHRPGVRNRSNSPSRTACVLPAATLA